MFTRIVTAGVLVCLVVGCAKKTAKFTGGTNDAAAAPKPQPPADKGKLGNTGGKTAKDGEKPNWLNDPRLKEKDDQLPVDGKAGKPDWGIAAPPAGGWTPPDAPVPQPGNPAPASPLAGVPQVQPVQPVAPVAPPVAPATGTPSRPTGGKPVTEADMKDVWIFIENASGASGKMPAPEVVLAALLQAKSPAAELVKDGSIWLTGAKVRESVWAFEYRAIKQGGWVATQNGVETMTAEELNRRLKGQ
jgi:hypothetical protein